MKFASTFPSKKALDEVGDRRKGRLGFAFPPYSLHCFLRFGVRDLWFLQGIAHMSMALCLLRVSVDDCQPAFSPI